MIRTVDIIKQLSNDLGLDQGQSTIIVNNIFDQMKNELIKGSDVVLSGFFILSVKKTIGRSLKHKITGITTEATFYRRLKCKFSKKFREEVKKH